MRRAFRFFPELIVPCLAISFLITQGCFIPDSAPGEEAGWSSPFVGPLFEIDENGFTVEGNLGPFTAMTHLEEMGEGLFELRVRIESPTPAEPPEFRVRWSHPAVDVAGFWNTNLSLDRVNFYRNSLESRSTSGAPVLALYNPGDLNRLTVAVSDALNPVGLRSYMREEDARFYFVLTFCGERMPETTAYEATIRLDARPVPFHEALVGASGWWAARPGHGRTLSPGSSLRW